MEHTIYFTKEITDGALKGIRINEQISHSTLSACSFWRIGRVVKRSNRGPGYRIVDASFQKYDRK